MRFVLLPIILLLATACRPAVCYRTEADPSQPHLGGFITIVDASPDIVWQSAHEALTKYEIDVSPMRGG